MKLYKIVSLDSEETDPLKRAFQKLRVHDRLRRIFGGKNVTNLGKGRYNIKVEDMKLLTLLMMQNDIDFDIKIEEVL